MTIDPTGFVSAISTTLTAEDWNYPSPAPEPDTR